LTEAQGKPYHPAMPLGRAALLAAPLLIAGLIAGCGGSSSTTVIAVATTSGTTTTAAHPAAAAAMVVELQQVMTNLGYYSGPIDGVYGDATTAAVKTMQKDLGVTVDGVYGPETHNALGEKGTSIVQAVQTTLTTYGYYSGPIDGLYGAATIQAVVKLQSDLGVTADGRIGPETITAFSDAVANGTIKPA
jgi:peptidoglycan hydrolase-like protein with peptidoglycan-binding domain